MLRLHHRSFSVVLLSSSFPFLRVVRDVAQRKNKLLLGMFPNPYALQAESFCHQRFLLRARGGNY
jgi:hypothetical protein